MQERATHFLRCLLDGDQAAAEQVIWSDRWAGATAVEVLEDVIRPAMGAVGTMWRHGELSIAHEHMATEITTAVLHRLLTPSPLTVGPVAIVACAPQEAHALGARALASLLTQRGWQVVSLGPRTPADAVELFVELRRPHLLALSVKLADHLPAVAEMTARIMAGPHAPLVLVGGSAVAGGAGGVAADCVSDDLAESFAWLDRAFATTVRA